MTDFPYPKPPAARRNLVALLGSPFGRIGRVTFVLITPLALIVAAMLLVVGIFLGERGLKFGDSVAIVGPILVLYLVSGSLMLRRLHDIGFPTAIALLVLLPRIGWMVALSQANFMRSNGWGEIALALLPLDILLLLVLALWPGQAAANRHGPAPD